MEFKAYKSYKALKHMGLQIFFIDKVKFVWYIY